MVTSLNEQLDLTKLTEEITKTTEGGKEGTNVVTVVRAAAQALNTLALTEITLKFMGRKFEKILKNGKGDKVRVASRAYAMYELIVNFDTEDR